MTTIHVLSGLCTVGWLGFVIALFRVSMLKIDMGLDEKLQDSRHNRYLEMLRENKQLREIIKSSYDLSLDVRRCGHGL